MTSSEGMVTGKSSPKQYTRHQLEEELERALRWIATRKGAKPFGLLTHAIEDPTTDSAVQLEPLVGATASLPAGTPETRAQAVWGLIVYATNKIGSTKDSRRRNALIAALRLPRRPEVRGPWMSTLEARFGQLMSLPDVFGNPPPITTTPMHKAWKQAVTKLTQVLAEDLESFAANGSAWAPYIEVGRETEATIAREREVQFEPQDPTTGYRSPSRGAQPVFLDLFVTTVFMKGRAAYRRITERLVTAREDEVNAYTARALTGTDPDLSEIPVRALWGCRAELIATSRSDPVLTKLCFPKSLRLGDRHYFSSEAIDENITEERLWINVEVDHHGIAPGKLLYGCVPIAGLTIRIVFDSDCLPLACWWYAEQTERERRTTPQGGDLRLLTLNGNIAQHTFAEKCHPRENYGVSFLWPSE